eukprot:631876-Prorocentrum_minimum.AAC.1
MWRSLASRTPLAGVPRLALLCAAATWRCQLAAAATCRPLEASAASCLREYGSADALLAAVRAKNQPCQQIIRTNPVNKS